MDIILYREQAWFKKGGGTRDTHSLALSRLLAMLPLPFLPASHCSPLRLAIMFPLLSRCVPWHRTQDRGSSPSPTHTWNTLTSCGASEEEREEWEEGREAGLQIDAARRKRDAAATSRAVSAAISSRLSLSRSNVFLFSYIMTVCSCVSNLSYLLCTSNTR